MDNSSTSRQSGTVCPKCGETLFSHAGRGWKYFHRHVIDGPYPNKAPHRCDLVNMAFERDSQPIPGSDEVRFGLAEYIHETFKREDYPNRPEDPSPFADDELADVAKKVF